jgi:hypothetical protein
MILNNKKAMIFQILLVIVMVIVLTFALFNLNTKYNSLTGNNKVLGEKQIDLMGKYLDYDYLMLYVDKSVEMSVEYQIYNVANNGGFYHNKCNSYEGYNYWVEKDVSCYPSYIKNFKSSLNDYINLYLKKYPDKPYLNFLRSDYKFLIKDNKLYGFALNDLEINIPPSGRYKTKQSFVIDFDYNLDFYDSVIENVKKMKGYCKSKEDVLSCVDEFISLSNLDWVYTNPEGGIFLFDVPTGDTVLIFKDDFKEEDVVIKFAVEFGGTATTSTSTTTTPTPSSTITDPSSTMPSTTTFPVFNMESFDYLGKLIYIMTFV